MPSPRSTSPARACPTRSRQQSLFANDYCGRARPEEIGGDVLHQTFLGLVAEAWTAIGTILIALATFLLAIVAYWQIAAARFENRKTQTLLACGQYDTSPLIYHCLKRVRAAKDNGSLKSEPTKLRREIITILNFLDAIAIGIEQNLYIEDLAYDHLEGIVKTHVSDLIDSGVTDAAGCPKSQWQRLIDLRDRWSRVKPHFRG